MKSGEVPVTREEIRNAFIAYHLAIIEMTTKTYPATESIEELAMQYGKRITTRKAMECVSEWYDWDTIGSYLENQQPETRP